MKLKRKSLIPITGIFSDWPFPKGEPETVYWWRSPRMVGEDKQWMMDVVFKRPNGLLKELSLPWGSLPKIRLGKEFVDGVATGQNSEGTINTFNISRRATCKIQKAITISPDVYPLKTRFNLEEYCVVIFDKDLTLIIPCLELIRFFFAINKMMAYRTLQPFNFSDLVSASMDQDKVMLEFTKKMPRNILSKLLVKVMAQVIYDPLWSEAWKNIYIGREEQTLDDNYDRNSIIPLKTVPPVFKNCTWKVRGLQDGKRFLVLEIISNIDNNPSPFLKVGYKHPKTRKYEQIKYFTKKRTSIGYETEAEINRDNSGPKDYKNPIMIKNESPVHKRKDPIIIEEIQDEAMIEGLRQKGVGVDRKNGKKASTVKVSLNDESQNGKLPAAEFLPFTDIESMDASSGLKEFFQAINVMKELKPEWGISYAIKIVPEDSSLAYCGTNPRKYALVKVININFEAYIMEFDLSDEHSISTIMFSPADLEFVGSLFNEYITNQGHWTQEILEDLEDIKVDWVKHMSSKPDIRVKSIVQKLEKLII